MSVERKGGVLLVEGFSKHLENPTFTLDEKSCQENLLDQMAPIDPPPCLWHMWSVHKASVLCPGQFARVSLYFLSCGADL